MMSMLSRSEGTLQDRVSASNISSESRSHNSLHEHNEEGPVIVALSICSLGKSVVKLWGAIMPGGFDPGFNMSSAMTNASNVRRDVMIPGSWLHCHGAGVWLAFA